MGKLHSMPMFWSDFFSDTQHMTPDAAKSYLFLLGHAWIRGAKLPGDDAQLARLSRNSMKKWAAIRDEILPMFTPTEDGSLTQKRMAKEWAYVSAKVEKNRENGALGGRRKSEKSSAAGKGMNGKNPNDFSEGAVANASETLKQPTLTPTPTQLEEGLSKDSPSAAPSPELPLQRKPVLIDLATAQQALDAYNAMAEKAGLAKAQRLTDTRRKQLAHRLKECGGLPGWGMAMDQVAASDFLTGKVKQWRADLDFILQASSFTKIMEGAYANKSAPKHKPGGYSAQDALRGLYGGDDPEDRFAI
jgi:uncharacterized protein YdaU (DUF1376 family)